MPALLLARLIAVVGKENEEEVVTAADQLFERGRVQGFEQGTRQTLLRLLRARFGTLPERALERVNAAEVATLQSWGLRVLTAATLEEALADE